MANTKTTKQLLEEQRKRRAKRAMESKNIVPVEKLKPLRETPFKKPAKQKKKPLKSRIQIKKALVASLRG